MKKEHTPTHYSVGKRRESDNRIEIVQESGTKFYNKKTVVCCIDPLSHYTEGDQEANARHIVHCVNSHDDLVRAVKYALKVMNDPNYDDHFDPSNLEEIFKSALANAKQF